MSTQSGERKYQFPSDTYHKTGKKALFGNNQEFEIYYDNGIGYFIFNGDTILTIDENGIDVTGKIYLNGEEFTGGGGGSVTSVAYLSLVNRVSANSAVGGGGSVTSAEHLSVDARATSLANAISVVSNALSVETANRVSASAVLDAKVSALSAIVISGIASVDGRATSIANAISVLSNEISIRHTAMQDPTGFENRTDSSFTLSAAKLEVTTGTQYNIWFDGVRHTISATKSVSISNTEGVHLVYFDTDDTLKEYVNPTTANILEAIRDKCLVSYIYWDAAGSAAVYVGEERHGTVMDGITHYYLHYTRGLQYVSGLGLSGFTIGDGTLDSHAQFGVDEGTVSDEDIGLTVSAIASNVGLPILYKDGADGYWRTVTQAGFACYQNPGGVTNRLMYNQYTGGAWQLTEIGESNYVLYHIFATTGKVKQIYSIMGENEYATVALARAGAQTEINAISLGTLPSPEMRPIATVIYQTDKDYGNTINARIVEIDAGGDDYVDWRTNDIPRGVAAVDYTALSNTISALEVRVSTISTALSALSARVVSGLASVDNAVSVVSNALSALEVRVSTNSTALSALSARVVSGLASIDGRATSLDNAISVVSNALSALEVRVSTLSAAPGGGGSVTSNEFSALEVRVNAHSDAISNEISNRVSVSAVLDAKISALSAIVISGIASVDARATSVEAKVSALSAIVVSGIASVDARATSLESRISTVSGLAVAAETHASTASAAVTSVDGRATSLEARVSAVSALVMGVSQNVSLISNALSALEVRVSTLSAAGGGGSVTSNEFSALEVRVSLLSATAARSNAVSVYMTRYQNLVLSAAATVSASAMTGVSGTTLILSAGNTYKVEGIFAINCPGTTSLKKAGLQFPAMNTARGKMAATYSTGASASAVFSNIFHEDSGGLAIVNIGSTGASASVFYVDFNGIMSPSATGNFYFMLGAQTGAGAAIVKVGSFIQAEKLR